MKIYLVRHGESSAQGLDHLRPLSETGQTDIKRLANFIAPLKLSVSCLWHSDKLRAKQTADILKTAFASIGESEIKEELDPVAPIDPIIYGINQSEHDLLLVGHMPFMGRLAAKLLSGDENKNVVAFKTGSMLCLEQVETRQWAICWMLTPALFT